MHTEEQDQVFGRKGQHVSPSDRQRRRTAPDSLHVRRKLESAVGEWRMEFHLDPVPVVDKGVGEAGVQVCRRVRLTQIRVGAEAGRDQDGARRHEVIALH